MNAIASTILWMSAQVALFSLVGCAAFMLLRRRGPSAAVAAAVSVLVATLLLSLVALSPWPHWALDKVAAASNETDMAVAPSPSVASNANSSVAMPLTHPSESILQTWYQSAADWYEAHISPPAIPAAAPTWNYWLLALLATGVALGLVRLATGIWAVRNLQRHSRPIADSDLLATVNSLSNELSIHSRVDRAQRSSSGVATSVNDEARSQTPHKTRSALRSFSRDGFSIQLRQCDLLRSAATVGWRRPVILLPADWRSWSDVERRVVLAHELAHIARRDYLASVLARIVTAVHFYQPLVLWLSRQLRIQQELAADSHAAAITGDRQTYLATLAQMALRADEQPLPWAARAFLPGTSLLIKRVAWLKRRGPKVEKSLSRRAGILLAAVIAAVAIGVAGIRGPSESRQAAIAADPEPTKTAPARHTKLAKGHSRWMAAT
jgi:BlaR1 peptidase M56